MRWDEAVPVKYCTSKMVMQFIFENIITRFSCPKVLMSYQGSNFLNDSIQQLTQDLMIHHQKRFPYHPQDNGMFESFNKS